MSQDPPSNSETFPPPALQVALAASLNGGSFSDTAFYLYSRRLRNWKIGKPRVVYANSTVLKAAASYFVAQLGGDFSTDQTIEPETDVYGYDSDSDLEDSEGEDERLGDQVHRYASQQVDQPQSDDENSPGPSARVIGKRKAEATPATLDASPGAESAAVHLAGAEYKYRLVVPDVAANTWQALVHFIYSGNIKFSPLKSWGMNHRREAQRAYSERHPHLPPLCSPKSVYRLADIIGIRSLKMRAFANLESQMSEITIAREVFSQFSSTYSDVLDMQLRLLYQDALLAQVMPKVLKMVTAISQGEKPYCENAVAALVLKLSSLLSGPNYNPPVSDIKSLADSAPHVPVPVSPKSLSYSPISAPASDPFESSLSTSASSWLAANAQVPDPSGGANPVPSLALRRRGSSLRKILKNKQ